MTDEELWVYNTGTGKSRNPKSIKRANEVEFASMLKTENAEAEMAKRKLSDPSSSSCDKQGSTAGEKEPKAETAEHRETSPTSDADDSYSVESFVPDDTLHMKCMNELGVPLGEINKKCFHYMWKLEISLTAAT